MDNPELTRLCPRCFLLEGGEHCRACGGTTEPFRGAPGAQMVIGRLRVLIGAPSLLDLVAHWSGPRRFPRLPWRLAEPAAVCRHHQGNTIWLWEAHWTDALAGADGARTLRALLHSEALMLELPVPQDPAFRAAFARSVCGPAGVEGLTQVEQSVPDVRARRTLPLAADLVADLEDALDAVGARPRRIALVYPNPAATQLAQMQAQLSRRGCQIHCEPEAQAALAWCIAELPTRGSSSGKGIRVQRGEQLEIGVLDLGGWLGRGMVAGLWELKPGPYRGLRLLDPVVEEPAALPRFRREFLEHLPVRLLPAPPWRGLVQYSWRRRIPVRLSLIEDPALTGPLTLVALAVGDNRLRGEQTLVRLLDLDHGRKVPLLLLKDARSDPQLLDWARQELDAPILDLGSECATAGVMRLIARCL